MSNVVSLSPLHNNTVPFEALDTKNESLSIADHVRSQPPFPPTGVLRVQTSKSAVLVLSFGVEHGAHNVFQQDITHEGVHWPCSWCPRTIMVTMVGLFMSFFHSLQPNSGVVA